MRKKLIVLTLALVLALSLGMMACAKDPAPTPPEPTLYTVTFVTSGGSGVPEQGVFDGGKITKPGDPTRGGYTFDGWFKEDALTTSWNFETDTVKANITLYAKWQIAPSTSDENFTYSTVEGGYMISAKLGATLPADIVIPAVKNDLAVISVADNGFEDRNEIKNLVLPSSVKAIGKQAFRNCSNLEAVNEGVNVAEMGTNAFYGTKWDLALTGGEIYVGKTLYKYAGGMYTETEVSVKAGTLGIAGSAFNGMDKLTKITLPDGLINIGDYAFGGSSSGTGIAEAVIPDSVITVSANAFRNAKKLAKVTIGSGVKLLGDNAFAGCPVTNLTYNAVGTEFGALAPFNGNTAAAAVTLNNALTALPMGLFKNWTGLTNLSLGSEITVIPDGAFDKFAKLATVNLENITVIGDYAFRGTALAAVTVPAGLTSITKGAFADCTALAAVTYNALDAAAPNKANTIFSGCTALAGVSFGANVNIPDFLFYGLKALNTVDLGGAKKIGLSAFAGSGLNGAVTIPDSVITIAESAFANTDATGLIVGANVTEIGKNAFAGNTELATLNYNAVNAKTVLGTLAGGAVKALFNGCAKLTGVTIGSGVKTIPSYFMPENRNLATVTLPEGITAVGDEAFLNCTALAEIIGTDNILTLGQNAFMGTPWIAQHLAQDGVVYLGSILYKYNGNMPANTEITVKDGIKSIAGGAFTGKTTLTSVILPDGLEEIGDSAFKGTSLSSLTLPSSIKNLGDGAFENCKLLDTVAFNSGLESIGGKAFYMCELLKTVSLPDSVTTVGASAFSFAGSKATAADGTLTLSNGLRAIADGAFSSMSRTGGTLNIPSSVQNIGNGAFAGMAVNAVVIPSSVKTIGNGAFSATNSLATATLPDSVTTLGTGVFSGSAIGTATLNGTFTEIPAQTFMSCASLTTVNWHSGVTKIGDEAFAMTVNLKSIDLTGITDIGVKSFNPDSKTSGAGLTSLTLPEGLKTIGDFAFADAPIAGALVIPEGVTIVGQQAFKNTKITSAAVPGSLKVLTIGVFRECGQLTAATLGEGIETLSGAFILTKIAELIVPASVTNIAAGAFADVRIVKPLCVGATVANGAFGSYGLNYGIFVPAGDVAAFKASAGWGKYNADIYSSDDLKAGGCVVDSSGTLIKFLSSAASLELPAEVKTIASGIINNVTTITVNAGNTFLKAIDNVVYSFNGETLEFYLLSNPATEFTVPDTVKVLKPILNNSLKTLTIGTSVTAIPDNAFSGAAALDTVILLSQTPPTLGSNAFTQRVQTITVPENCGSTYREAAGWSAYADFIAGVGETVKEFVIIDGKLMKYNGAGGAVEIPDTVTAIDVNAFKDNAAITGLTIGNNITAIPNGAFATATNLTSIVFNATAFPDRSSGTSYPPVGGLFPYMTTLTIGADVTRIPNGMFADCYELASVTIPATVTEIGNYAFYMKTADSSKLATLILNEGLKKLGNGVFSNCALSGEITIPSTLTDASLNVFLGNTTSEIVLIYKPANLTVSTGSWLGVANIIEARISEGVLSLPASMFAGITALKTVNLPNSLTTLGLSAFSGCTGLTGTITIPTEVTVIPGNLFQNCSSIEAIIMHNDITEIGSNSFNGCTGLGGTLNLSNKLTKILRSAFKGSGYTEVIVNSNIAITGTTTLPDNITKITFSANVTTITGAFNLYTMLKEYVFLAETPPTIVNGIHVSEGLIIKVPAASVEAYKLAWVACANYITAISTEPPIDPEV